MVAVCKAIRTHDAMGTLGGEMSLTCARAAKGGRVVYGHHGSIAREKS